MREDAATYPFWMDEIPAGDVAPALPAGRRCVRIGLSESWLETLGEEPVGFELLAPGTRVGPGEAIGFLHTPTRTLDMRAPLEMELLAHNRDILSNARLVTASPYGRGWLAEVRLLP